MRRSIIDLAFFAGPCVFARNWIFKCEKSDVYVSRKDARSRKVAKRRPLCSHRLKCFCAPTSYDSRIQRWTFSSRSASEYTRNEWPMK